ncbi:MAG: FhaA domain-containing protein [Actinomycetes bacterium]
MGVLQRFERRIEEMVNRPFARAFKADVQPVEIASALQRELDDRAAIVARGRTMVPNAFLVQLGERDHERLAVYEEALANELASMVREHADEQGYAFIGPVSVEFARDEELSTGRFLVQSKAVAGATGRADDTVTSGGGDVPWVQVGSTTYALARSTTRIGRGTESDLRIDDPGISRHHAELRRSGGDVTVVDLGSTNGVVVDGERVEQARLRDGSTVVLGNTTLVFHAGPKQAGSKQAGSRR